MDDVTKQRRYYANAAKSYDSQQLSDDGVHGFALSFLESMINHFDFDSVLDVGSGTGRVLRRLKVTHPHRRVTGVEPVDEMRAVGYQHGLTEDDLLPGDATALNFETGAVDLVCAFGVLHHIKQPRLAVAEMLRVSKRAIFISDSNNFGQGGKLSRGLKQAIHACGLWPVADWVRTGGRGYQWSQGDGVYYSYSLFDNLPQIRRACPRIHLLSTQGDGANLYRSSGHVALLGLKSDA